MSAKNTIVFEPIAADHAGFVGLLQAAGLPTADLAGPANSFWGCFDGDGMLVVAGGIEQHGDDAIIRSCVVRETGRGRGLGAAVVAHLVTEARRRNIKNLYLLTESAEGFFKALGFDKVARDAVPPLIAASAQFAEICPASAVALMLSHDKLAGRGDAQDG